MILLMLMPEILNFPVSMIFSTSYISLIIIIAIQNIASSSLSSRSHSIPQAKSS